MTDITHWPARKPRATDWTPEQVATLRALAGEVPAAAIAAALGRSEDAVRSKAAALHLPLSCGAPRRAWTDTEIATLRRLARTHTLAQAAAILGRPRTAVARYASWRGISFRKYGEMNHSTKYSHATIAHIHRLRAQGLPCAQIGRIVGMTGDHVAQIVRYVTRYREMMALDAQQEAANGHD